MASFPNDFYGGAFTDRDRAIAIGTMMGEAWKEGIDGMAAVGDVIANRMADKSFTSKYGPSITSQAYRASEFSTWSPKEKYAYETATKAAFSPERLSGKERAAYQDAVKAFDAIFVDGSKRGISQGATFYSNTKVTAALGTGGFHGRLADRYGSTNIGNHTFTGPNFGRPEVYSQYSALGYQNNTPAEVLAAERNMAAQREVFRGPSDFGAPVWDGTYTPEPSLAAPVTPVDSAPLPDIAPTSFAPTGATGFYGVEDPYSYGMYTPAAAPAPDLSPTGATGFYGVEDPYSYGMYSPNSYAPGPDLGANLNSAVPSSEFGMDVGPTSFSNISAGTMGQNPGFGAGITPEAPQGVNDALTIGREISVGPLGYAGTGGFGAASSALSPNGTVVADIPSGMPSFAAVDKAMQFDPATFSYSAPAPWSDQVMGGLPDKAPATPNDLTPKDQKVDELPGYQLPPEIAPPTSLQGPSRAAPASVNVPSSSPTTRSQPSTTAVPSLSLPSLPSPINVPTLGISPSFETPASTAAGMLSGFGSPDSFLGSVMNGNMSGIGGLNTALGMDFSGMAQRAVAGDQYAQPAMLGLERAYAQATGQPGPKGLFDGLFGGWGGSPTNDGLGAVRDQATGAILGNFDPSDPQRGGFFGGLFGGGGDYGGLGTTPGAGGLY